MKSPMELFFKLGDKVTKGDPKRLADWNYYFLWIIFFAFLGIFIGNVYEFYLYQKLANLGWGLFGFAIMWFQYWSLKQAYGMRKLMKEQSKNPKPAPELKVDSVNEMLEEFK